MSYIFDVDDETVWSPALRVGDLYTRYARELAATIGAESGLIAVASDMYDLDIDVFERFVRAVLREYVSTTNGTYRDLVRGVLVPSIVMLQRAGRVFEPATDEERDFLREVEGHGRTMPR